MRPTGNADDYGCGSDCRWPVAVTAQRAPTADAYTVVAETADFLIVDKPAGLHSAPLSAGDDCLLARLLRQFPEVAAVPGRKPVEPGLIHRLDAPTSGLVLVARTVAAFELLVQAEMDEKIQKIYDCRCGRSTRCPPGRHSLAAWSESGTIATRFRAYGPGRALVVCSDDDAAPRHGDWTKRVYRTDYVRTAAAGDCEVYRATIRRGFRHQIRCHLATLGRPICGDRDYGGRPADRLYLHAAQLCFEWHGRRLLFESQRPWAAETDTDGVRRH